jgi:tetratricopeptide (TPR) repeat protein
MKNRFAYIVLIMCLLALHGYANAQPISKTKENAATQELIQSQSGKQLTALDWYNRGVALNDNSDQELACYKKAVELDPKFAPAYYNMGIIYMKRGNNIDAIASFNQFLKFSNDETKKQEVQKVIVELGGEPASSTSAQSQSISSNLKQEAIRLYNAGAALNDNSDKEMQYYLQAIVLDPELASAHLNLGLLYYHRKDYNNALTELTKYIEYTNDPPAKRKEVLNLIEWLKIAVKNAPGTIQNEQPTQPQSAPVQMNVPSKNNTNSGTPAVQEVPLQ